MLRHKSAIKAARQDKKRTERNRAIKSQARTALKKVRVELDKGSKADKGTLEQLFREAQAKLMSTAQKGVMKKATVARYISRLHQSVAKAS